jgi:hypothetical protein
MRMWLVDPALLCRQHLLGEHKEVHMLAGCVRKGKTLGRYLTDGLVDPTLLRERHEQLVEEMGRRGYNHRSPLQDHVYEGLRGRVNPDANLIELARRCPACRAKILAAHVTDGSRLTPLAPPSTF